MKYNGEYDDIINMPHHVSKKHPPMSKAIRAAQFAPFAALTGYDDQVKETARLTNERKEIAEGLKLVINEKIMKIQAEIHLKPEIEVTYFIPDLKKQGGKYVTVKGNVRKVDEYRQLIIFEDKREIPVQEIIEIVNVEESNNFI